MTMTITKAMMIHVSVDRPPIPGAGVAVAPPIGVGSVLPTGVNTAW